MRDCSKSNFQYYQAGYEAGRLAERELNITAIQEEIDVNMPVGMQAGLARAIKAVKELKI